jgi:PEP-CTERM motif
MKKTLLLIGALAFAVSASAQNTLYFDDFEGQVVGNSPQNIGGGNAGNISNFPSTVPPGTDPGGPMWNWVGGGGNGVTDIVWQTGDVLDSTGFFETQALQFGWTDAGNAGSWGFGFSSQAHTSQAAMAGGLSDLTLSFDVLISGTEFAASTTPLTIWFDQFPGGVKALDASYLPTFAADGTWQHISFTLDNIVPSGGNPNSAAYLNYMGIEIAFDAGTGASMLGGDTANIELDNILLLGPVPEPTTIALLTLGGLGALVAFRRRS